MRNSSFQTMLPEPVIDEAGILMAGGDFQIAQPGDGICGQRAGLGRMIAAHRQNEAVIEQRHQAEALSGIGEIPDREIEFAAVKEVANSERAAGAQIELHRWRSSAAVATSAADTATAA